MALVMLPSDLPWWDSVKKHLKKIANTRNTTELIEGMQKIYELCNVSLDPDDDTVDPQKFVGLLNFLDNDLTSEERSTFLNTTLPGMVNRALNMKGMRPKAGLHFSLQQQPDCTDLDYCFVSSLLANAFFSTFPRRTEKTHPTLQNFNFSEFFKSLNGNVQKSKLKSVLHYFEWLERDENVGSEGKLRILRQVMSSKEWLTIEDWLECNLPLCALKIRYDGKLDRSEEDSLRICFTSSKVGGKVLKNGYNQECINLITAPELLTVLLSVEALEDNEVLTVEGVRHLTRISDPKQKAVLERLETPQKVTICCMDADDYTKLPIGQYEEDNILRELNKCLLGFQQKQTKINNDNQNVNATYNHRRRLSPIGESMGSVQSDSLSIPLITQQSCSTRSGSVSPPPSENNNSKDCRLQVQLEVERSLQKRQPQCNQEALTNRRGRFIVLGSSGECLPVKRRSEARDDDSQYSSCESSEGEFQSAKTSLDDASEDEANYHKRYSLDLETPERRHTFAQRLKDALRREFLPTSTFSSSDESSYAVGISVTGSRLDDPDIRVRRGGSTGFALREESLDEDFLQNSLQHEKEWVDKFKHKQSALSKRESNKSSEYSFSTDYSSELEEVYEQFSRWLENPLLETEKETKRKLDARELAVVRFAGSILKRTLSESFAGVQVPMTESCDSTTGPCHTKKNKLVLNAKSLSLELARQKHRLAAQLLSEISRRPEGGPRPVSTGNWGCGSSRKGDVQLKVIVQWLAASVAGVPYLTYYTYGHQQLAKLDTVCRILVDRKWTVKDLAEATLRYSNHVLHGKELSGTLFEELISDRTL